MISIPILFSDIGGKSEVCDHLRLSVIVFSERIVCFFRLRIPRVLAICVMLDGIAGFLISLPHFIADEKMSTDGVTLPNSTIRDNNTSSRMLCTDRAAALADQEVG